MIRKKYISYFTILLITASTSLFFYCNSSHETGSAPKNGADNNPYFPLSEGAQWNYINQAPREETELYNVEVLKLLKNKDDVQATFNIFPYFTKNSNGCTVRITNAGEVFVKDSSSEEKLLLPAASKLQKDYSWNYGQWDAGVMDTNVTVVTDNKTFNNCIYIGYSLGGITFSVELWLAKDAGIVKWGANRTNPPQRSYTYYVLK